MLVLESRATGPRDRCICMSDILQLRNLHKTYPGDITAVAGLSLEVRQGEFITLLGPSGCGKTTTIRLIAGFEEPDSGSVILEGEDITSVPPYQRNVNTVFQEYALFPHLTIYQNVLYGLQRTGLPKKEIAKRAAEALEMVELQSKTSQHPHMLSGGQKQRVALARALVCNPKILLLDEPLSALDAKLREAMQVELKTLHESIGLTFILVTHDQTEAMVMSDRVVIMDQGTIVQIGQPSDLYERPVSSYVANFIGTSNFLKGVVTEANSDLVTICTSKTAVRVRTNGCVFRSGQEVVLCIRPEKIFLLPEETPAREDLSVIPGVLADYYFHGNFVRYRIEIDGEESFFVDSQLDRSLRQAGIPPVGSRLLLGFHPDSSIIFD